MHHFQEDLYGNDAYYYNESPHHDEDFDGYANVWHRNLAAYAKEKTVGFRMDYSVLSVAVMTLGLIMVVEVFIHRLNHAALGRPYFTAVLENIYNERKDVLGGGQVKRAFSLSPKNSHQIFISFCCRF